jgi:hypothetical protein
MYGPDSELNIRTRYSFLTTLLRTEIERSTETNRNQIEEIDQIKK